MKDWIKVIGSGEVPAGPPTEFQLLPLGEIVIRGTKQPVTVEASGIEKIVDAFKAAGQDMVIDYEHQTEGKMEDGPDFRSPDGTAPAAGWIKQLVNKGADGLWAVVDWTDRAKQFLRNREYRYYSPVFYTTKDGRLVQLLRVALTNAPRMTRIRPIVAGGAGDDGDVSPEEEQQMDWRQMIVESLGMDPGATDEEVAAKLKEVLAAAKDGSGDAPPAEAVAAKDTLERMAASLKVEPGQLEAHVAKLAMTSAGAEEIAKTVADLASWKAERTANDLVAQACKEGKVTPSMLEFATNLAKQDPERFAEWAAVAPTVAPMGSLPTAAKDTPTASRINEHQTRFDNLVGVSKEDREKYGSKP